MDDRFEAMRKEILVCAAEDMTGVWEAWFQANGSFPDLPMSERMGLVERALRELLEAGLIILYRGTWAHGDQRQVPTDEGDAVLREYDSWVPANDRPTAFFLATDAGSNAAGLPPIHD